MLNEVKHPDWIYLTLSAGADVPLLLQGDGQEGEVCHPQFVMLNDVKHPCTGFLTAFGTTPPSC